MAWTSRALLVAIAAVAALSLPGCGVSDESMVVLVGAVEWGGVFDPNTNTLTGCNPGDVNDGVASGGRFDVDIFRDPARVPAFKQGFHILNQLPEAASVEANQLEVNTVLLDKAVITYSGLEDATDQLLSNLVTEIPVAAAIEPEGYTTTPLTLIPSNIAQVLRDQLVPNPNDLRTIIVNVQLEAHTVGQTSLKSSRLSWPVDVCNGCLSPAQCTMDPVCGCAHF